MLSSGSASSFGAVITFPNVVSYANTPGCIALIDGDESPTGCAAAVQSLMFCRVASCAAVCPKGTDLGVFDAYSACEQQADATLCATQAQAAMCEDAPQYAGCIFVDFESYFRGTGAIFCAALPEAGRDSGDAAQDAQDSLLDAVGE
jgi:hypothetical protein